MTLLRREALSTERQTDPVGQRAKYPDAASDDGNFASMFSGASGMPEALRRRRGTVDGSVSGVWSRGRVPWWPGQRSDSDAQWRSSVDWNDVELLAAVRKVEELIARRRLLDKRLDEVRVLMLMLMLMNSFYLRANLVT